jgi:hypothetical protein
MKKALKWVGIAIITILALVIIMVTGIFIYDTGITAGWNKSGVPQRILPSGVNSTVAFNDVSVIPMDSEYLIEAQTVIIKDNRIAQIGYTDDVKMPADAYIVDGAGKFLIPGLSDMHMHTFGAENDLLLYLANGVTTIRSMGSEPPTVLKWRDQILDGTRVGPTIWAWWPIIKDRSDIPGDPEWGIKFASRGGETIVHTPGEAEALVAEMAALGVDGIKSHYVVSSDIYLALLNTATRFGLPFDGHAPHSYAYCPINPDCVCDRADCWDDFRTLGAPALAHVEELVKMVDLIDMETRQVSDDATRQIASDVADDGLWSSTTIYLFRSIVDQATDLEGTLASMAEVKYVHPTVFKDRGWGPENNYYGELGSRDWYPNYLEAQEKMLFALNESGALLLSGTDSSLALLVPGFSLHNELETMADVGLSTYDVLRTSTYNPALYLGELDEFGTIEVGKRADLVLLEANPLEDIANTRKIAGVMVRGRYFDRADLDTILNLVAKDYEGFKTTWRIIRIAFPIVVILLLVGVVWIIVKRTKHLKSKQVSE